jgi:hypothetical protein
MDACEKGLGLGMIHVIRPAIRRLAESGVSLPPSTPKKKRHNIDELGRTLSPHFGHSIRSKSTRLTRSGVMVKPHLGHVVFSDACTFSKSIFRDRGMRDGSYHFPCSASLYFHP